MRNGLHPTRPPDLDKGVGGVGEASRPSPSVKQISPDEGREEDAQEADRRRLDADMLDVEVEGNSAGASSL